MTPEDRTKNLVDRWIRECGPFIKGLCESVCDTIHAHEAEVRAEYQKGWPCGGILKTDPSRGDDEAASHSAKGVSTAT